MKSNGQGQYVARSLGTLGLMIAAIATPCAAQKAAPATVDMKKMPICKPLLDHAIDAVRENLRAETTVAGVPVRVDLGNSGGVSLKSANLRVEKLFPLKGKANLVFDLHFRHVVTPERTVFGIRIPAVISYDRHEELIVEYDIHEKLARARVLKGPFTLLPIPAADFELWMNLDLRDKK